MLKFNVLLEVIEDLTSVELLYFGVRSHTRFYDLLLLQHCQALFNALNFFAILVILFLVHNSYSVHASEEDFEYGLHIIYKHPLKILLSLCQYRIGEIFPHLVYNTFINVPIFDMRFKLL